MGMNDMVRKLPVRNIQTQVALITQQGVTASAATLLRFHNVAS